MPADPEILQKLEDAFSPSAPITAANFFFGRLDHLENVVEAIKERGQQIVVYGERGVGKTSFANNVTTRISGIFPVKVTCNRTDGFKRIWDRAFHRVHFEQKHSGIGFVPAQHKEELQLDLFLPKKEDISSIDIQFVLEKISIPLLFVFDEFDTIEDKDVISQMPDTMKSISDNAPHVTIMAVGVGSTITDLVGLHESISRCLRQIRLPRMSSSELREILVHGAAYLNLRIVASVENEIVRFSQGFPHFTHLLGKHACKAAVEEGAPKVGVSHLRRSIYASVDRVDETVRSAYQRGTMTAKASTRFRTVVWACADAKEDEHGTFKATEIAEAYSEITQTQATSNSIAYYIGKLCSAERGRLLEKLGSSKNVRYRFRNPLLRAYIQLKRQAYLNAR